MDEDSQQFEGQDDNVDERMQREIDSRGEGGKEKFTDKVKPAKMRADAPESVKETHEYDDDEKDDVIDAEQGDLPIDSELMQSLNQSEQEIAAQALGGMQGPLYRKMMRSVTDTQAQDISFWAKRNTINLNPIKWNNKNEPIAWKYTYKRKLITNEVWEKIQQVYQTPLNSYERNQQLASLYYGVPKDEFDKQDAELWVIIIRAQQFRSNLSFR